MMGRAIAWLGTAAWAFLGWFYVFHYVGLSRFAEYEPEKVGEFFIGFFAPLAFFWIIVGYFQQGATLKRHAQVLERQIAELRTSPATSLKAPSRAICSFSLGPRYWKGFSPSRITWQTCSGPGVWDT